MCELFGISAKNKIYANELLREFFSHSKEHPHGWGMAVLDGGDVSLEKEPIIASRSVYLRQRLRSQIKSSALIAHIRMATIGTTEYENTHPFCIRDGEDRPWTLAHNGTIFNYPLLNPYFKKQEGGTDSERILLYMVSCIDRKKEALFRPITEKERFSVIENIVHGMSTGNKLNLLIFDGENLYVHSNVKNTLHRCVYKDENGGDGIIFSTTPIGDPHLIWESVPLGRLVVYRNGELIYTGKKQNAEFIDDPAKYRDLYLNYSML